MGVKFFGQFLLERGVIKNEHLLAATRYQESRNRPLGAIAISMDYLSAAQAAEINRQQQSTDRRFGELARELGWMTDPQIEEVLAVQRSTRVRLGEVLVELGFISDKQLQQELEAFAQDQAPFEVARIQLPVETQKAEVVSVCIDLTEKLLLRAGGLQGKRGIVVTSGGERPPSPLLSVRIPFTGAVRLDYTVSASRDVAFTITRRMLGNAVTLSDELAIDALKEFCNVVCGNICAKLSHADNPVEIGPPEEGAEAISKYTKGILVPMHMPDGRFELRLHFP